MTGISIRIVQIVVLIIILFEVVIGEDFIGLLYFGELVFAVGVDVGVEGFDEFEVGFFDEFLVAGFIDFEDLVVVFGEVDAVGGGGE